jgi:hypothetical protein
MIIHVMVSYVTNILHVHQRLVQMASVFHVQTVLSQDKASSVVILNVHWIVIVQQIHV